MLECFNEDGTCFRVVASVDGKFKLFQTITEPFVRNNFDPDLDLFFFFLNEMSEGFIFYYQLMKFPE